MFDVLKFQKAKPKDAKVRKIEQDYETLKERPETLKE